MKPPANAVRGKHDEGLHSDTALMIDGKVVSTGKVLKAKEVEK